ncbi:hypothetical protein GO013_10495 [Pseudodesulfovibrio sp. JC047]|uniref:aryl-sulfate sulfotransferase n=1 Tax=Pseudodesulfovibrio sp. JC047 TaxID=2683199 RepID=UPI0013CFE854|nr:aryl-sulfate sulfotransferase [Pseudodesulfovibrio sp. JC047]NDV19849.1 hypothetical protein [Pseudodesulfovibrio sp. JC047]
MRKRLNMYTLALAAFLAVVLTVPAQAYESATGPTGVLKYTKGKAFEGYTLFSPMVGCKTTYLIDMEGNIVHTWDCDYRPGLYAELLPNGNLLRGGRVDQQKQLEAKLGKKLGKDDPKKYVSVGGASGLVQEIDWDGNVVWEYKLAEPNKEIQHHTFHRMPNGNTLILAWEYMTREEAIKKGRDPKTIPTQPVECDGAEHDGFWNDFVREVDPAGKTVWEWHVADHMGKGPKKLDFNFTLPQPVGGLYPNYDWSHFNTVDYIPETDTIVLNSRNLSEFYFVNHKTGELEYRWGNPSAYDVKAKKPNWYDNGDQQVFGQHCATPLDNGNILLFDNGSEAPEVRHSRAVEVNPKTNKVVWEFATNHSSSFNSHRQGGVQRLPNGNTLICSTHGGHVMEVTKDKKIVWEFVNPIVFGKAKCVLTNKDAIPNSTEDAMFNMIHRAFRYGPDYAGLQGRDLTPQGYICGDDCPRFFRDFKRGAALGDDDGFVDDEEDTEEEDGPCMHAY